MSNGRAHTGSFAVRARNSNISGQTVSVIRTMAVVPGKQYQFKAWYMSEKPLGVLYIYANEFGTDLAGAQLDKVAANVWNQREVTFTANSNLVLLPMMWGEIVQGEPGNKHAVVGWVHFYAAELSISAGVLLFIVEHVEQALHASTLNLPWTT